jgi:hypothetical protein
VPSLGPTESTSSLTLPSRGLMQVARNVVAVAAAIVDDKWRRLASSSRENDCAMVNGKGGWFEIHNRPVLTGDRQRYVCLSTRPVKNYRIRLSVSERRSTTRQIQSKSTEFVCLSSTRPLLPARNGARRPDRFSKKVQNSSVRRQPVRSRWLGTAFDGQTYSVKKYRIRLSVNGKCCEMAG